MKRERALSERGCELFNVCYGNAAPIKISRRRSCLPNVNLKTIFHKFMTSEFDIQLEKHEKKNEKSYSKNVLFSGR